MITPYPAEPLHSPEMALSRGMRLFHWYPLTNIAFLNSRYQDTPLSTSLFCMGRSGPHSASEPLSMHTLLVA
jgi:hypothetical protein